MWNANPAGDSVAGLIQFRATSDDGGDSVWSLDVRGGNHGIRISCAEAATADTACFALEAVGDDELPELSEQFVRGDELHLVYPQGEGNYALRLVLQPIDASDDGLVLEAVIAIQTNLLDSHPMVDLVSKTTDLRRENAGANPGDSGAAEITVGRSGQCEVAALLGPHDSPFTLDGSWEEEIRLRLFGEFLEKGVIRKARPWLVMKRSEQPLEMEDLRTRWNELSSSPLPLTP